MNALDVTLLYLLAAVLGVVACRYLRLPPILGYLLVGVLIGPNALALAQNSAGVRYLAEFGIVFLMFVIGLEFSLSKLKTMGKHVFGLGASQVLATIVIATVGSLFLAWAWSSGWHMDWKTALALGCVMSMSSTAVVIKLTADRSELETEHGKRVVGIFSSRQTVTYYKPFYTSPQQAYIRAIDKKSTRELCNGPITGFLLFCSNHPGDNVVGQEESFACN